MFKQALNLVFSRWALLAVLLLAWFAALWLFGPLVAFDGQRPLDSPRARLLAGLATVLLVLCGVAWRQWRARRGNAQVVAQLVSAPTGKSPGAESADLAAVRQRFEDALKLLRRARFSQHRKGAAGWWQQLNDRFSARYLYQLPWYLIIGAPGTGKTTALRNAGLQFPLASQMGDQAVRGVGGTRDCDWWFTDRAVLIDTAGRFTTQDSDKVNDKATWAGFLGLLKRSRPRQPLNGVLVTVSMLDLAAKAPADHRGHVHAVRARLQELYEHLGISLPVYLLVTKCDLMGGFTETFATLDKEQRALPWGFAFAPEPGAFQAALPVEFDALVERLNQGQVDRLQAETDLARRVRIYGFPTQLASLRASLLDFVQQTFAPSPFEAAPMLRGVYFVSGTQEGAPMDRVLGALARRYRLEQAVLPPLRASGRSYFLERVLGEVVFAEQGLAGTNRSWERRRNLMVAGGYGALGLLGAGLLLAWWNSWRNNSDYVQTVAERSIVVQRLVQETPNSATPDLLPLLPALQATQGLARAGTGETASVPWTLGFGLYQGQKLDGAARIAYEQMLREALLPRLALRLEQQLRQDGQADAHYEALKSYLMLYERDQFDPVALKRAVESDWDSTLGLAVAPEQREALSQHLDALLAQGAAVSPLPRDQALVDSTRNRLAAVELPQRVYKRLRQQGLGEQFPEFTVARAAGANALSVFVRTSGKPLTRGVPGLFTYKGYHEAFQSNVDQVAAQLAQEQPWVLGSPATEARSAQAAWAPDKLVNDVRRLYLTEYRDTWKDFIADIRMLPPTNIAQTIERTRFLAAYDSPLPPLLRGISRETTLLAGQGSVEQLSRKAEGVVEELKGKVLGGLGAKPSQGAPGERIESIVDDEFAGLRRMVTAPVGGKAPVDAVVARLGELQVLLTATETALKGGGAPQPTPLPNQIKAEAASAPEPVRSLMDALASAGGRLAQYQLRESLSREVRAQVGEFCQQAVAGRYPLDRSASRDVTPADFAALFGPGGRFDQMQQRLAPYIDTSTRPSWTFRPVEGSPLGTDVGSLPQFQRAAAIKEAFFPAGSAVPTVRLVFKPLEMSEKFTHLTLDIDGQLVRYDHGPQLAQPATWPGPKNNNLVLVAVQPSAGPGLRFDGPWALFKLFERVALTPGDTPAKFRANFDFDGRKAQFEVTSASVHNPLRLAALTAFSCPNGL